MSDNTPEAVTTPPSTPTLTVKYNHESRTLSAEDAATYAQMGLKYEAMQPTLERLTALAAGRQQTLEQYVTAAEDDARRALLTQVTDPQAAARAAEETLAAETARMREQMAELTALTGVESVQDLPEAVRDDARRNGRTLLDAWLRHQWQQQRAVACEHAANAAASAAAVGSRAAPPPTDSTDSLTHAMMRGLHSVL